MRPTPKPARLTETPAPGYPSLGEEHASRGISRRRFLLVAAAGSAGAMTGCMGAPPPPAYPRGRWVEVAVPLGRPLTLAGCAGAPERATYDAVTVSSPAPHLVRWLGSAAGSAAAAESAARIAAMSGCHHSTLELQRRRAEGLLRADLLAAHRTAGGLAVRPADVLLRLRAVALIVRSTASPR